MAKTSVKFCEICGALYVKRCGNCVSTPPDLGDFVSLDVLACAVKTASLSENERKFVIETLDKWLRRRSWPTNS
jgi:hypothetical protein